MHVVQSTVLLLLLFLVPLFWNIQLKHRPFNWHQPIQCCEMKILKISNVYRKYQKYRKYPMFSLFSKISRCLPSLAAVWRIVLNCCRLIPMQALCPHTVELHCTTVLWVLSCLGPSTVCKWTVLIVPMSISFPPWCTYTQSSWDITWWKDSVTK